MSAHVPAVLEGALVVLQGRLRPGSEDTYRRYLEGTRPLLAKHGGSVAAVGGGIESAHASACWPVNGVLRFPSAEALVAFFEDPGYQAIKPLRDAAYAALQLSFFATRPPRA